MLRIFHFLGSFRFSSDEQNNCSSSLTNEIILPKWAQWLLIRVNQSNHFFYQNEQNYCSSAEWCIFIIQSNHPMIFHLPIRSFHENEQIGCSFSVFSFSVWLAVLVFECTGAHRSFGCVWLRLHSNKRIEQIKILS